VIHRVFSDLPKFKQLMFRSGLNVLLADKSPGATDRQTRNGAGKTSVVELIHFLTGSRCDPDAMFRTDALVEASFGMEFDLGGAPIKVTRSGRKPAEVLVDGDWSGWPISPGQDRKTGRYALSNEDWKTVLASAIYKLSENSGQEPWRPTFRSLFAYFARRERAGGFHSPVRHSSQQQIGDQQIALSFLMGLDWSIPQQWQQVRERERSLRELKRAVGEGALGPVIESVATLRTRLAVAEEGTRRLKSSLASFRVLEQYHDLEAEASHLTRELGRLADENVLDRRYLAELEAATSDETPPAPDDLEQLYEEVGVALPGTVRTRFEDVKRFHESVIRNRRAYLSSEVEATRERIDERNVRKERLDTRRSEVMSMLQSHGALEHFTALQAELARVEAETESLRQKFDSAEALEAGQLKLNIERTRLLERLHQDYREQRETLDHAIVAFEEISRSLYERAGSLTIDASENGPQIEIHIHGEKSKGISNMQIFCFDMMLTRLCIEGGTGPGFLIHDSHLFDGVDERQTGKALEVGARLADQLRFQYIVTLNSDAVPTELPSGFFLEPFVLPVRLTDATEDGGLFGLRFQ